MEIYFHPSLYRRRKSLPLPSLSLYPLYSDIYLQVARIKAVVFVFAPCFRAQSETCRRPPVSVYSWWWKQPVIAKRRCLCAGLTSSHPRRRQSCCRGNSKTNKIFSLLLIFNLREFLHFITKLVRYVRPFQTPRSGGGGCLSGWPPPPPTHTQRTKICCVSFQTVFRFSDGRIPVTRSGSDFANNCGGSDYWFTKVGGRLIFLAIV